ncbi:MULTISPECIES: hypothetical protein [Streptomyces]|uniref:Uncharacterized protein n=2 Tax=Streptomyces rimosus subsp. rimosus TaxID=132474 RepID=L8EZR7_STRR1|nr:MULTISPECIES: hypothetical protein [Streptomyces]KOG69955.1 hypothetical protein ADK78_31045 [Kitasatospora aureofaciens]MYT42259.1 hypothetical protein [Streptomyces sp. SID5471]KOT30727.1 hypothetical protein ADK84_31695 [Streptomyces sp. NRRL WC-3701]KOT55477.1 hypothetical protein ADK45_28815 [Streptomyces rimosus subsp. rimosus]KOT71910.1 hypothetical protein ADK47_30485 [Streptomyces rimosus subsp. rimosus]
MPEPPPSGHRREKATDAEPRVGTLVDVGVQDISLLDEPEADRCPTGAPLQAAEQSFSGLFFQITGL